MENALTAKIYYWIENKSKNRYYVYYLALALTVASLFFATPKYLYIGSMPELKEVWETVSIKANDLTNPLSHLKEYSHAAKTVFRLTVPVFVKLTGVSQQSLYIVQFSFGFFLLVYLFKLVSKLTSNKVLASFFVAGITFLYFGRACFVDFSWYDGWAFLGLIMAMYSSNFLMVFLFCSMAAWTDERAFIVLPVVVLFKQIEGCRAEQMVGSKLIRLNRLAIAALSAIIVYGVVRIFLSLQYNMHTPNAAVNLGVLKQNLYMIGIGLWTVFEGFWIIIMFGLLYMVFNKHYLLLFIIVGQMVISIAVSMLVFDITRSGSFLVPILLVFIKYLAANCSLKEMNYWVACSFIISFLFPAYYVIGGLNMYQPAYFEFIHYLFNRSLL